MDSFNFKVEKDFGCVGNSGSWSKNLTLTSWNGKEAKFDLRTWKDNFSVPGKGISFSKDELIALKNLINSLEL